MKETRLPFACFQRKSLEVQESEGGLAVTLVLPSAGPAVHVPGARGDSSSLPLLFPEAPEQRGSLTSTNQYTPLFLMCLRSCSPIRLPVVQKS